MSPGDNPHLRISFLIVSDSKKQANGHDAREPADNYPRDPARRTACSLSGSTLAFAPASHRLGGGSVRFTAAAGRAGTSDQGRLSRYFAAFGFRAVSGVSLGFFGWFPIFGHMDDWLRVSRVCTCRWGRPVRVDSSPALLRSESDRWNSFHRQRQLSFRMRSESFRKMFRLISSPARRIRWRLVEWGNAFGNGSAISDLQWLIFCMFIRILRFVPPRVACCADTPLPGLSDFQSDVWRDKPGRGSPSGPAKFSGPATALRHSGQKSDTASSQPCA